MEKKVTKQDIANLAEKYIKTVEEYYGESNHQETTPYVYIGDCDFTDVKGEFCHIINEITVYWENIGSLEELIRVIVHEYQHYLQSPSWMTRYYKMGHTYESHPYEVAAYAEEENWKKIWEAAA
tara:strand:+ start:183 stop:554 length:372 start_codon:yes stop_codon:yes gene_type:complete